MSWAPIHRSRSRIPRSTKSSAMIGMLRFISGISTILPDQMVVTLVLGCTASAPSAIIVSGRVVAMHAPDTVDRAVRERVEDATCGRRADRFHFEIAHGGLQAPGPSSPGACRGR